MATKGIRKLQYVDPRGFEYAVVDIDLLVPDTDNPRIPPQESALDAILALIADDADALYALGKDIVDQKGTNPFELVAAIRSGNAFLVKEGNRRIAAQRILRRPEQLRGHVKPAEYERWQRLAQRDEASRLPTELPVVIADQGEGHDGWVDRRHLGPQDGVGVQPWKPQAKARRAMKSKNQRDRTISLLDGLKAARPAMFNELEPPDRTFTTLARLIDSTPARAHIGVDVDAEGNVTLRHGERSLRYLEEILKDLRKKGKEKLTSRTIHNEDDIANYLEVLDERVTEQLDENALTLSASSNGNAKSGAGASGARSKHSSGTARRTDVLKGFARPSAARPEKLFAELRAARHHNMANAAMILTRVFLEITIDHYANTNGLPFAGDRNVAIEEEVKSFRKELGVAGIRPSRAISNALDFASTKPLGLGAKMEVVIKDLISKGRIDAKEGNAKIRELKVRSVVELLNDAVHRLQIVPSIDSVDHILEIVQPVYNAMMAS